MDGSASIVGPPHVHQPTGLRPCLNLGTSMESRLASMRVPATVHEIGLYAPLHRWCGSLPSRTPSEVRSAAFPDALYPATGECEPVHLSTELRPAPVWPSLGRLCQDALHGCRHSRVEVARIRNTGEHGI